MGEGMPKRIFGIIARSIHREESKKMSISGWFSFVFAATLVIAAAPSPAAESGNAAAGGHKSSMCKGCHGIPGYKTAFPEVYSVPKLGGQHPAYLAKALEEYKAGNRSHPTMRAIAAGLSEKDIADLAAYYGGAAPKTAAK
jgi:cytochrome c553